MNKEAKEATINPADTKWKQTFRLYSWWDSLDGRTFMILQRWFNYQGELSYIDLVERNKEGIIRLTYSAFFEQFAAGKLQSKSASPPEAILEEWPSADSIPNRSY